MRTFTVPFTESQCRRCKKVTALAAACVATYPEAHSVGVVVCLVFPRARGSHRRLPTTSSLTGEFGPSDVASPFPRALPSDALSRAPARTRIRTAGSREIVWVIDTWWCGATGRGARRGGCVDLERRGPPGGCVIG